MTASHLFAVMDSQPSDSLTGRGGEWHSLAIVVSGSMQEMMLATNALVPRTASDARFLKWADSAKRGKRKEKSRLEFIDNYFKYKNDHNILTFIVSSTEYQISRLARIRMIENSNIFGEKIGAAGRKFIEIRSNVNPGDSIIISLARFAKIIWFAEIINMVFVRDLFSRFTVKPDNIIIHSDWLAEDSYQTTPPAIGASLLNFLISGMQAPSIKVNLSKDPSHQYEILADWFAGWGNTFVSMPFLKQSISRRFNKAMQEPLPNGKLEWIQFNVNIQYT